MTHDSDDEAVALMVHPASSRKLREERQVPGRFGGYAL
jgi:hypothetical protein